MSLFRLLSLLIFTFICLNLTACNFPPRIYRMDVRQGNYITPEMVAKLKKGLSKEQVKEIMGTPALTHTLNANRWDYYYYLKPGMGGPIQEKRVSIFFKGNVVSHFTSEL